MKKLSYVKGIDLQVGDELVRWTGLLGRSWAGCWAARWATRTGCRARAVLDGPRELGRSAWLRPLFFF
jgi:hypothetical protein